MAKQFIRKFDASAYNGLALPELLVEIGAFAVIDR
jgi:hypothetical protein